MHALPAPEVKQFVSNGSAFCARFSFPQVLNAWRSAGEAISKRTYFVASAAYILWIVHGVMIGSVPIIVFNVLALLLGLTILSGGAPNRKTRAKSAVPGIERGKFEELARAAGREELRRVKVPQC
jgi:MtN3 and saliva related transmembrane protein